jgi:hypothetical protein
MRAESPPEPHVDDHEEAVFCHAPPGCRVRVPDEDGRDCNVSTTREECGVSAIRRSGSRNPGIHDACSQSAVRNAHSLSALRLESAALSHPNVESVDPVRPRNSPAGREAGSDTLGLSGRSMLETLIADEQDPDRLAGLARGLLKRKTDALRLTGIGN